MSQPDAVSQPHEEPLWVTESDGLHLPDGYGDCDDRLIIRAPQVTKILLSGVRGYLLGSLRPRDWSDEGELQNPGLLPNEVSLKRYGEPAETFAVELKGSVER